MPINIYKDPLQMAYLFGAPVLYSSEPIPREDVPLGWYCYDLCGTNRNPDIAYALVDQAEKNYAGSVLSYLPLKNGRSQSRLVGNMLQPTGEQGCLADFCARERILCPDTPLRHRLCPASPEEAGLFYALPPEKDKELGTIGHVRIDFGYRGKEFHHSWWPRGPEELNTPEFQEELYLVMNDLRSGILKDLPSMRRYCYGSEGAIGGGTYGFTLETDRYLSTPVRFCSFSPNRECRKMASKRVQPLNNYTCRFRPSSLKQADKSGLDGHQTGK